MKTLYITDLDGTLLDDTAHVSPRSAAILSDLSRRGALISVATARTPATVVPLLADVYTATDLVVMTGAALWDTRAGRFADISILSETEARAVVAGFEGSGISPFCYCLRDDSSLEVYHAAANLNPAEAAFVEQRTGLLLKKFHLATPAPEAQLSRMVLAFAMGSREGIVAVAERLSASTSCYVSYYKDTYNEDMWLLEVFAGGVSKANRARQLAERLGVDRIVAFGDNLNDIPLLRLADVAVAVSNALPETKAEADIIIGANTDDAVARFIAYDFANNK